MVFTRLGEIALYVIGRRHERRVAYTMTAWQKSDGRVNITAKPKSLTVRGPSRISAN